MTLDESPRHKAFMAALAAHRGGQVVVGDTASVLRHLQQNAEQWRIELRPYNASSYEVVAKEEAK